MQRRDFFRSLLAAVALRKVPVELAPVPPAFPILDKRMLYGIRYATKSYSLGYTISREMLETMPMIGRSVDFQVMDDLIMGDLKNDS